MNPGMKRKDMLSDEVIELVAARFRCLGEPMRLKLLQALESGEKSVGQLVDSLGATQANVSRHLKVMVDAGLLARRPSGTSAYYSVSDPAVFRICEVVCDSLADSLAEQAARMGLKVQRAR